MQSPIGSTQQIIQMGDSNFIMMIIIHLPYLGLIAANLLYLWMHGFKPIQYHPKLIFYNFLFFLLVGLAIFFKVSYHLHRWFAKGEGDVREKTKEKIRDVGRMVEMVCGYFRPGNLHNLVYLYAVLASWTLLSYLVPGWLLGTTYGLIFQLRSFLAEKYPDYVSLFWHKINTLIAKVEEALPKYEQNRQ